MDIPDVTKPNETAERQADPRARKPGETLREYLNRLGVKIANDDDSCGLMIIGAPVPSDTADDPKPDDPDDEDYRRPGHERPKEPKG